MPRLFPELSSAVAAGLVALALAPGPAHTAAPETWTIGAAAVDITPSYPIRLSGFGFRRTESEGVTEPIHARALAIGDDRGGPVVVIAVENLGVSQAIVNEIAGRLQRKAGIRRENLAVTATHTHTAPMLAGVCPTLFGEPIPEAHQARIERYTREFVSRLEEAALQALRNRSPATLAWSVGRVEFARNRRTKGGPVDHDLPVLVARAPDGSVRFVWTSYACHCVTLSNNRVSGDWAGFAMKHMERQWPGAVALVSIGCGADANPSSGVTGDRVDVAMGQGEQIASEVRRLLGNPMTPLAGPIRARMDSFVLDLAPLPGRDQWLERANRKGAIGYHARVQLARLDRGEKLPTQLNYSVQSWQCGDRLAMVFLPGEVVVDYALRLKRELDSKRLWINAYSNDAPCYIPSERILSEGGYEGGDAMIYYDRPARFKAGIEDRIVRQVHEQLGARFRAPADSGK